MDERSLARLVDWMAAGTMAGRSEAEILEGMCRSLQDAGLGLWRVMVGVHTLHPVIEAWTATWRRDRGTVDRDEYSRYDRDLEAADDRWRRSPFYRMLQDQTPRFRCRLTDAAARRPFPLLEELAAEGATDYVAVVTPFHEQAGFQELDCLYSSWTVSVPGGFTDADQAVLTRLIPHLALSIKANTGANLAKTLVETYLGRETGRRVLRGAIARGETETISTVLWFSDLQDFTRLADALAGEAILPLLNDYADAIVSAIHGQDGEVLKFMGDGLLAIFPPGDIATGCRKALAAFEAARAAVAEVNRRRGAAGEPVTGFTLGLHVGEVLYGNIGSRDRLDFTVVGPAVNEVSRLEGLCRSLDREIIVSQAFVQALDGADGRNRLVSLGRYALKGLKRAQELYTLDGY